MYVCMYIYIYFYRPQDVSTIGPLVHVHSAMGLCLLDPNSHNDNGLNIEYVKLGSLRMDPVQINII